MTLNDDLPREYHDRGLEVLREGALRGEVLDDFRAERARQLVKWGPQRHPDGTSPDYSYERDDYRAYCDKMARQGNDSWLNILREEVFEAFAETDPVLLDKELVQAGAVITAWLEDLRSRG